MLPHRSIESRLQAAVEAVLPGADVSSVLVRPCPDPKFGDFQTNALIALAKERQLNPRQLAADVLARLDVGDLCEPPKVEGAGFVNFHLKTTVLEATLEEAAKGEHLFFEKAAQPQTVVIDFSSPNVAKPMHVGHIRSTFLGDSLARTLRLLGHRVITDNHIGDWGTQFGKLLLGWKTRLDRDALARDPIAEMERFYKEVNAESEVDPAVLEAARQELVKLQRGDEENLRLWQEMIRLSEDQFKTIYSRLGVSFDYTLGESFYNPMLAGTLGELEEKSIARASEGAVAVFSDGSVPPKLDPFLKHEDGGWKPNPLLIRKSDGAANYATTDLATLAYRLQAWHPNEIVYVTDGRQQLHFRQVFATFRRWHPEAAVRLEHVWFGTILGEDGKPFRTRTGEVVRLTDLLDEAEERALKVVSEKNEELPEAERREIARVVGLGAVKYADLLPNRQSDYTFSWDKMLALNGNTAPYLQYAYARISSIFRKGGLPGAAAGAGPVRLTEAAELALAKGLLNFDFVLNAVVTEFRPNYLCNYLYDLAGHFTRFYEQCPVLKAAPAERASRLVLCALTAMVLRQGLENLGIETLEQM